MLKDLDHQTNYLESIDNGEENLEIKLENLKKNDWKRMNSPVESDNRLALVHMGFDCSLHDIYNPEFSREGEQTVREGANGSEWNEEDLWSSRDEHAQKNQVGIAGKRESASVHERSQEPKKTMRKRWSVADLSEYQRIKEKCGKDAQAKQLYDRVKNHFSDFYDIEFIDQVWQMRDMRGQGTIGRGFKTPSPSPSNKKRFNFSSESKFNLSRFNSNTDSLNVELSCINNAKSELESKWNESMMGILDNLPGTEHSRGISRNPTHLENCESQKFQNRREPKFDFERRSHPTLAKNSQIFGRNSITQEKLEESQMKQGDKAKSSVKSRTRFRKRKGISGTNSLSEMNEMFDESLSHVMFNLNGEKPREPNANGEQDKPADKKKEKVKTVEKFTLEGHVEKLLQEPQILNTFNGMTIVTESGEERQMGRESNLRGCIEREPTTHTESFKVESISEKIKKMSVQTEMIPTEKDTLSYREMVMSGERGLNFLIENWKELGTLKNPPNTIDQFSERKGFTETNCEEELRQVLNSVAKEGPHPPELPTPINPDELDPGCFIKKEITQSKPRGSQLTETAKRESTPRRSTARASGQSSGEPSKKAAKNRSTPQNGKKVQVPLLKYPFSKFYLPNSQKVFTKSLANFSRIPNQNSRGGKNVDTLKTISDNFLFEQNPPKSHRQFSNKERLRNEALKKKLKINSKKNSKELQKILELKKKLIGGKSGPRKGEESLRRQKTRKLETKCFQSDRNLSIQKSRPSNPRKAVLRVQVQPATARVHVEEQAQASLHRAQLPNFPANQQFDARP